MTAFPFTQLVPEEFSGPLPRTTDVVIVGGGVIGVATALFLARRKVAVALVEKGRIAGEQSSRNWGWIRQQGRDAAELPIVIEAQRLWRQIAAECGEDIGLQQAGVTYLAETDEQMAKFANFLPLAKSHGVDTRLMSPQETAGFIPGMARKFKGAMTTPSDMRAEPWTAVPALARLAAREGAVIIENCAARALDIAGGRIAGVVTEKGRVAASQVLVAGGAWSSLFLRAHGITIPQLSVRSTVAATEPLAEIHGGAAADERIAFRRRQDGGYTLAAGGHQLFVGPDAFRHAPKYMPALRADPFGTRYWPAAPQGFPDAWGTPRRWDADRESPFERMRILDPEPEASSLRAIERGFATLFPTLGPIKLKARWAGMIDAMPDVVPVVDCAPTIPGLFIGTGMSGHGFGIGPGMGRILAGLVQGNSPGHDLTRFRLSRFTDGSPMRPGPAL